MPSPESPQKRITEAAEVLHEIMSSKDRSIPEDLLEKAQCVGIVPNLKRAGFIVGAKYGKGVVVCRTANGWSAPSTVRIEGGSIGLQIGAGETDVVFIVMNERGVEKLMKDKFTIGADASAMAGPVGRSAEARTDAMMHAEIHDSRIFHREVDIVARLHLGAGNRGPQVLTVERQRVARL